MDSLILDYNYFREKAKQADKVIWAENGKDYLDDQFNNISDYLNNVVKVEIDNIVSELAKGIIGSAKYFLQNVGNGSTSWKPIDNNAIDDHSLNLNKIVKATIGSVLCSNLAGNLTAISPTAHDQVLVAHDSNIPVWSKLTDINIYPNTITGQQLGQITIENFQNNVFTHNVLDNSIETQHILDNNITNDKIIDGIVDYRHIGIFYGLVLNQNTKDNIHVEHFADGSMPVEKFLDGSIQFSTAFYEPLSYYPYREPTSAPIYARHVANGSITDAHLVPYNPNQEAWFCVGGIDAANWRFGEKLTGDKIMPDKLTKGWFTPDVQQAMSRFRA